MAVDVLDQRRTEIPLPRRGGDNQIYGPSGKPLLVIVEGADVDAMVDAGLEAIGGLKRVIGGRRAGDRARGPQARAGLLLRAVGPAGAGPAAEPRTHA